MKKKIHFIGIGGIGMSALALIYKAKGYGVSGSDMQRSSRVSDLEDNGISVFIGEEVREFEEDQIIVINPAIRETNIELIKARKSNCKILMRSDLLKNELDLKKSFAISGSHGKTTTSSILSHIFTSAQEDPTWIVGGILNNYDSNYKIGNSDIIIAEADESDMSFLKYHPDLSIITNIDDDHLDFYKNSSAIDKAFLQFAKQSKKLIANFDDKRVRAVLSDKLTPLYFSRNSQCADLYLQSYKQNKGVAELTLVWKNENFVINTSLIGEHNIENTLAAILCALDYGIDIRQIQVAMNSFLGTSRRLEVLKTKKNFKVYDDYGHHPTAIKKVISTLKSAYPDMTLRVIFEPHRYTRTRDFWKEFTQCFEDADELMFLEIYSAGEDTIAGIDSDNLLAAVQRVEKKKKIEKLDQYVSYCENHIVLILGAGSISEKARSVVYE